ncbi:hypothetical protein [Salipaludibacillus daqingensis]|uniref:hypothetical protein n=1 Tax=Salipaludibacillus daqingensis TaxID=3041001 RepID=UPI0024733D26|nr:hypothetical protein [Salipaludibacillus daqingensis]
MNRRERTTESSRKENTFKKDREKQMERDQSVMPVDEIPLEDVKYEEEEQKQKNKPKSKDRSSTDRKD